MADRENCSKCGDSKKVKNLNLVKNEWVCNSCMGGGDDTVIKGNTISGGFFNFGTVSKETKKGWW